jgi:cytochrome c oxidase subunit 2
MSTWSQLNLQDAFSPVIEEFIYFHDFTNIILLFILSFVGFILARVIFNKVIHKSLLEGQILECIWTLIPALILIQIALPSLVLLYTLEEYRREKGISLKATGHQWYWRYEYPEFYFSDERKDSSLFTFDSYIVNTNEISNGEFRLLETDNRVNLPSQIPIRILVTRGDVLHAWAMPSLGLKVDAVPGRLNQLSVEINAVGVFYGQCSEICGANHRFMPISVQFLRIKDWAQTIELF